MSYITDNNDSGCDLLNPYPVWELAGELRQIRDDDTSLYPELDTDGENVHIEMMSEEGAALLWLTMRRENSPSVAAKSLRKIADFIERHGDKIFNNKHDKVDSVIYDDRVEDGPLRLGYDEYGDVILPVDI